MICLVPFTIVGHSSALRFCNTWSETPYPIWLRLSTPNVRRSEPLLRKVYLRKAKNRTASERKPLRNQAILTPRYLVAAATSSHSQYRPADSSTAPSSESLPAGTQRTLQGRGGIDSQERCLRCRIRPSL